jgi:histidine triad (HIT) family protein
MRPKYNIDNIFWKIIKEEIPCKKVVETPCALSFHDINPKARIHVLVIPKGMYIDALDFFQNASPKEVLDFYQNLNTTIEKLQIRQSGCRLITNNGVDSHQEVPHFHIHILGGESLPSSL